METDENHANGLFISYLEKLLVKCEHRRDGRSVTLYVRRRRFAGPAF